MTGDRDDILDIWDDGLEFHRVIPPACGTVSTGAGGNLPLGSGVILGGTINPPFVETTVRLPWVSPGPRNPRKRRTHGIKGGRALRRLVRRHRRLDVWLASQRLRVGELEIRTLDVHVTFAERLTAERYGAMREELGKIFEERLWRHNEGRLLATHAPTDDEEKT